VAQLYRVAKALGLDEVSRPLRAFVIDGEQDEAEV
jgi:hypothetical protein